MNTLKKGLVLFTVVALASPALSLPPAPAGKKWVSVPELTDEFNGFSGNKWQKGHPYWSGRSPSQFNNNNISFANGKMRLKMTVRNANRRGNWMWSAAVTSKTKAFRTGMYSEVRMKAADLAAVSSFWMQGDNTEIDVIENWGRVKVQRWNYLERRMSTNTHYFPNGIGKQPDRKTPKEFDNPGNARNASRYFTFGVWWKNQRTVVWFLDGVRVGSSTMKSNFNQPMFMFFDMEPFSWGPGIPTVADLRNNNINTAYYDFVRTYRLANGSGNPGGNPGGNTGSNVTPPSGLTTLQVRHSSKCVDVEAGLTANGTRYHQWACNTGNINQRFQFISRGNGLYGIKSQRSNRCVDIENGNSANGTKIQQYDCANGNANQSWRLVNKGGGWFEITSQRTGKCLDVTGVSSANGAKIQQWECLNNNNQQFRFLN